MGKSADKRGNHYHRFVRKIGEREDRKKRAGARKKTSVLAGFLIFGRIGWTIVVPGVIGITLGAWIDSKYPGSYSWGLMLLAIGIVLGCINAWNWLEKEHRKMRNGDNGENNDG